MPVDPRSEKFNIASNDHGHIHTNAIFCVSVSKINFTDHHTSDAINGFRDSVLVCEMHYCYCTYNTQEFRAFPFLLIRPSHQAMYAAGKRQAIAIVRLCENEPLQNVFKHI